jgi:hypothetical protein
VEREFHSLISPCRKSKTVPYKKRPVIAIYYHLEHQKSQFRHKSVTKPHKQQKPCAGAENWTARTVSMHAGSLLELPMSRLRRMVQTGRPGQGVNFLAFPRPSGFDDTLTRMAAYSGRTERNR